MTDPEGTVCACASSNSILSDASVEVREVCVQVTCSERFIGLKLFEWARECDRRKPGCKEHGDGSRDEALLGSGGLDFERHYSSFVPVHRVGSLMALRDHMRMGIDLRTEA